MSKDKKLLASAIIMMLPCMVNGMATSLRDVTSLACRIIAFPVRLFRNTVRGHIARVIPEPQEETFVTIIAAPEIISVNPT